MSLEREKAAVHAMKQAATLQRVKQGYTTGARSLASRSVTGLARTRVTPNALTTAGVSLCLAAAVLVPFEGRSELLFYWVAAATFGVGEGAMLAAIALVFARHGNEVAVVVTIAAVAGSFLVPYVRAKAEALGLRGDVGLGSRAERVVVITAGLVLAPWGALQWAIYLLAATAWLTVVQRILHVRKQLIPGGPSDVH
jgi:phosphatidylglycerophosphate synthase